MTPPRSPFPWPLVFGTLVSTAVALTLGGQIWRASPIELTCGWPLGIGWPGWTRVTAVAAALAGIVAAACHWLGWRRARAARLVRPWAGLVLLHGAAFFGIWFLLPASDVQPIHWLVAGAIVPVVAVWALPGARWLNPWQGRWRLAPYLYLDLVAVCMPVVFWLLHRTLVEPGRVALALATYPVYALFQLIAVLALPAALMGRLGLPRRGIVVICATMFALLHWPNPLVMAATGVIMIPWAMAHLGGRRLLMSAVIMGVAAASFTQFMPVSWTYHMKVGPGLVRLRAVETLGGGGELVIEKLAANVVEPVAFLRAIYPQVIGREATPGELAVWDSALTRGLRCDTVYFLALIDKYRQLAKRNLAMPPPPTGIHWTEAPPPWRPRIEAFGSDEYWRAHGANIDGYFRAVWVDLFGEEWPQTAPAYISPLLSPPQCRRLVEVLHEQRPNLRRAPLTAISDEALRWTR